MPKNMNIKKAASAIHQNQKQIKAALSGAEVIFAAVEKSLGRAQFLLKLPKHKTATGTPRGLFTCGTMRISPGQIVIVEGNEKTGFEIVGRIDDLSIAKKLVKSGTMSADILTAATTCGTFATTSTVIPEEDIFDYSETQKSVDEVSSKGGAAGERRQRESIAAAHALAARLGSIEEEIEINLDDI
jgi:translation initiation factor IF-1